MNRLIIKCDGVSHEEALRYVSHVVEAGFISEAAGIPHYCWGTRFKDGVMVAVSRKRQPSAADAFTVYRERDTMGDDSQEE